MNSFLTRSYMTKHLKFQKWTIQIKILFKHDINTKLKRKITRKQNEPKSRRS